jgi:hypothetical protein
MIRRTRPARHRPRAVWADGVTRSEHPHAAHRIAADECACSRGWLRPEIKVPTLWDMGDPVKDTELEVLVPEVWRPTLRAIVDSLVRRDVVLAADLTAVDAVSVAVTQLCLQAVANYGDVTLIPLPEDVWDTSVTRWHGDRWSCLIDLWTEEEGRSDLVLNVDVFENGPAYRFLVHLVYVP